jgi:bacteriocin biosynthesis cyclodehydratase domain-containing protein
MLDETSNGSGFLTSSKERLDQALVVNPHLRVVHCSDDEILVKHGSRSLFSEVITDDKRTKLLGKVLRNLRVPTSMRDLYGKGVLSEEELPLAEELVTYLGERGVLMPPETDMTRMYLDTVLNGAGDSGKIGSCIVGLVGAGYLGSRIARELVHFRPKQLLITDPREVVDARISGKYLDFGPEVVKNGMGYAECLHRHLSGTSFEEAQVLAGDLGREGALDEVFERADFVIAAWENFSPSLFHSLNASAVDHKTPWMLAYFDGSEVIVGPTYVPGESCCYYEYEMQSEATLALKDEYFLYKEDLQQDGFDVSCVALPPYLQVAAGLATTAVLRFLMGGQTFTAGRAIRIDFERFSVDYQEVLRLPRCPACSPGRPPYKQLFL